VVSFMPLPLYLRGKSPRYPLDRRLGGPKTEKRLLIKLIMLRPLLLTILTSKDNQTVLQAMIKKSKVVPVLNLLSTTL
jgi:hypothetical protein